MSDIDNALPLANGHDTTGIDATVTLEETPDEHIMPDLKGLFVTEELKRQVGVDSGVVYYVSRHRCMSPDVAKGETIFARWFLGTKDDPEFRKPETRKSRSWTDFKKFIVNSGIPVSTPLADLPIAVKGTKIGIDVGHREREFNGSKRLENTVLTTLRPGDFEPGLKGGGASHSGSMHTQMSPEAAKAMLSAASAPVIDE
jgi:hypothetical protein